MVRYEEEFNRLIAVERHLVNASSHLSTTLQLLYGTGLLHDDVRQTLEALDGALKLTRKTKKVLLNEWQRSTAPAAAA